MHCMCIPAFAVTSADTGQLWVYLRYIAQGYLLLFTKFYCLGVVVDIVLHKCTNINFMVTGGNIS